jgi:hypothetical protein
MQYPRHVSRPTFGGIEWDNLYRTAKLTISKARCPDLPKVL